MILYLDTSSFIKLYVEEEGSEQVRRMAASAELASSSVVAYVEMRAALARIYQSTRLDAASYQKALRTFEADWPSLATVALTEPVLRLSGELAERHLLKALDAIHLASAVTLQQDSGDPVGFSGWDARLKAAAASEGLTVAG